MAAWLAGRRLDWGMPSTWEAAYSLLCCCCFYWVFLCFGFWVFFPHKCKDTSIAIAAYLLEWGSIWDSEIQKKTGRILILNQHLVSRMVLNCVVLIFCVFTSYFVLSITESKQSFFRVPVKQCPAISHLDAGKVLVLCTCEPKQRDSSKQPGSTPLQLGNQIEWFSIS